MKEPEQEPPIIYKSAMSPALGAGWDVLLVSQSNRGSIALARHADGTIMRKTDSVPETWEVISDEEMLRLARQSFDNRDKAREEKATSEDESL